MKRTWISFTVGALVAGLAISLLAPQTGKSARKKIRRGLEDFGDNFSEAADYLKKQAERLAKEAEQHIGSSKGQLEGAVTPLSDTPAQLTPSQHQRFPVNGAVVQTMHPQVVAKRSGPVERDPTSSLIRLHGSQRQTDRRLFRIPIRRHRTVEQLIPIEINLQERRPLGNLPRNQRL